MPDVPQNFPQFPVEPVRGPNPKGIPVSDPKQGKPLWKMINFRLHPRTKPAKTVSRSHRTKKNQVKYW